MQHHRIKYKATGTYTIINPCDANQFADLRVELLNAYGKNHVTWEWPEDVENGDAGQICVKDIEENLIVPILSKYEFVDYWTEK